MPAEFWALLAVPWAALNGLAVSRGWRWLEYVTKPAVMLALLAWLWPASRTGPWPVPLIVFALGLALSLVGDVCLMLPADLFLPGLVAFLLAHLAYIAAFNLSGRPPLVTAVVLAVPLAGLTAWLTVRIGRALAARGQPALRGPVVIYSAVLAVMVLSALTTLARPEWKQSAAALTGVGAVLFLASDSLLAWNRFVAPVRHGPIVIIAAYHLGQFLMTAGVISQFVGA